MDGHRSYREAMYLALNRNGPGADEMGISTGRSAICVAVNADAGGSAALAAVEWS
jgi:hypothetical protein